MDLVCLHWQQRIVQPALWWGFFTKWNLNLSQIFQVVIFMVMVDVQFLNLEISWHPVSSHSWQIFYICSISKLDLFRAEGQTRPTLWLDEKGDGVLRLAAIVQAHMQSCSWEGDHQIEEKLEEREVALMCSVALCSVHSRVALWHLLVFSQDLVMPVLSSHFLLISESSSPAECRPWLLLAPVAGL